MGFLLPVALGMLQGLTEFLPVSSSGHLALASLLLGVRTTRLALEIGLHVGTLCAVVWAYRTELAPLLRPPWEGEARRLAEGLFVATVVTGVGALFLRGVVEPAFTSLHAIGIGFAATTILLVLGRYVRAGRREAPSLAGAFVVGLLQALATWPGLSRSGSTIVAAQMTGLAPAAAARFSFFLSLPTIIAAAALTLGEGGLKAVAVGPLVAGIVTAAVVGAFAIRFVQSALAGRRLHLFALYTGTLAALCLLLP